MARRRTKPCTKPTCPGIPPGRVQSECSETEWANYCSACKNRAYWTAANRRNREAYRLRQSVYSECRRVNGTIEPGTICGYPGCNELAVETHHDLEYDDPMVNDPMYVHLYCKQHHLIADAIKRELRAMSA